jgi:hypothetical protein
MLNQTQNDVPVRVFVNDAQYEVLGASIKYARDGGAVYTCTIRPFSNRALALEQLQAISTHELRLRFARETLVLTAVEVETTDAGCIALMGHLSATLSREPEPLSGAEASNVVRMTL